jgi:hypothetical protein
MHKRILGSIRSPLPWGLAALALSGCSGGAGDGLEKYPVRGSVLVNGEPAGKLVVTFQNADPKAPGNAANPIGMTDDQGHFELSTNDINDGAVAGEYRVAFFWPSDDGPLPTDRLGGLHGDASRSKHKVRVEPKENDLEPFRLEVSPKVLKKTAP